MIHKLRKRMILVSAVSILLVFSLIFLVIYVTGTVQLNNAMDTLTDMISENGGRFPDFNGDRRRPKNIPRNDFITSETPFSTRFFTVWLNEEQEVMRKNIDAVASVTDDQIRQYTQTVLDGGKERGWISDYRYKVVPDDDGAFIVFVNGSMNRAMTGRMHIIVLCVFAGSSVIILLLIVLLSKRAVRPAAESYEKQKQFITDANHELKTPLTLILSNLDIVEAEIGKNEWLDDIRSEGQRMSTLVNRMVALTRMDEDNYQVDHTDFCISDAIADTVSEFVALAESSGISMQHEIAESIIYHGNESEIRQLTAILLDNALKYCDDNGAIHVTFSAGRHPVLRIENTFHAVDSLELHRLFDRFYRSDKARTAGNSFGIGLSIAKAITEHHKGTISVQSSGSECIAFIVKL